MTSDGGLTFKCGGGITITGVLKMQTVSKKANFVPFGKLPPTILALLDNLRKKNSKCCSRGFKKMPIKTLS